MTQAAGNQRVGIANDGSWGIPVKPNTRYRATLYAKAGPGFAGSLTVAIASSTWGARRAKDGRTGAAQPATPPQQAPLLFFNATRDSKTGTIYVKVVNRGNAPQSVHVQVSRVAGIQPKGQLVAMTASGPEDTNSITEPSRIVPVTTSVDGLSADFTRTFPPYSVSVLLMKGK